MILNKLGRKILWQRARDYLRRYQPQVVGITGSTGKTIVKDAVTLAIGNDLHVRSAPRSYNTRLGVALTILGVTQKAIAKHWLRFLSGSFLREHAGPNPEVIILELAANKPGDIDFFARSLPFTQGVITNTQLTHMDLFARQELLAHEFSSLIVDLQKDGLAILNLDDPLVKDMMQQSHAPTITYGQAKQADVRLLRWHRLSTNSLVCEILLDGTMHELHLPHLLASYHLPHVLAAIGVAHGLGINTKNILKRLQQLKTPPGRVRKFEGRNSSTILDDSYNASPASTIAALQLLGDLKAGRRIAILGDMLRLGAESHRQHEQIGEEAAKQADVFVTVGENMKTAGAAALKASEALEANATRRPHEASEAFEALEANETRRPAEASEAPEANAARAIRRRVKASEAPEAPEANEANIDVHHFATSTDAGKWMADALKPQDLILVKGSRDMQMEVAVAHLLENPDHDKTQLYQD